MTLGHAIAAIGLAFLAGAALGAGGLFLAYLASTAPRAPKRR